MSTSSPRAALTMRTPGRIMAIDRVVDRRGGSRRVSGACSVMKSACCHSSSRLTGAVTCSSLHRSAVTNGSCTIDLHPQTASTRRDQLADSPEADDAERLVGQLDSAEPRSLPPPRGQRGVRLGDVSRHRQQQPQRVLGGRHHVRAWRVDTMMPRTSGGIDVHVVHPGAGPADHLQPGPRSISSAVTWVALRTISAS